MIFNEEGMKVCPRCFQRNLSDIINHDITAESLKHKGMYWFTFKCKSCESKLIDYCNMDRKKKRRD